MGFIFQQTEPASIPTGGFGSLSAIITLILLPGMCFLSIPAVIFAKEAKRLHQKGVYDLSESFARKSKRYTVSAWAVFAIVALTILALYFISRLSLI